MKPFFSVIIPLYNKESFIEDTLKSVFSQTFQDFEIIIVNDGSTDGSLQKLKRFKDKRLKVYTQTNQGLSAARNTGIRHASANYLALIDADDFWLPNHLEQLYSLVNQFPNMGMYCTGYTLKKSDSIFHRAQFNGLPDDFVGVVPNFFKHSLQHCIAWVGAVCIPKSVFNTIGDFDLEIYSEQDTDLYIRIALNYDIALNNSSASAIYNRTMDDNMSNYTHKNAIPKFLNSYKSVEKTNPFLKKYMDLNRFSTIIFFKLSNNKKLEKELIKDIEFSNLNFAQRVLLKSPNFFVKSLFLLKTKLKLNPLYVFKTRN